MAFDAFYMFIFLLMFCILHTPLWQVMLTICLLIIITDIVWLYYLEDYIEAPWFLNRKTSISLGFNLVLTVFWFLTDHTDLMIDPLYKGERISGYYVVFKIIFVDMLETYFIWSYTANTRKHSDLK